MLLREMKQHLRISHTWLIILAILIGGQVSAQWNGDTLTILMKQLQEVEVSATRVQQTTISHELLRKAALNRENTGQNLPYL